MKNFPAPNLKTYNHRPHSNLTFSGSIKHRNENDYQELRQFLFHEGKSLGDYLVESYRELDQVAFTKKCTTPYKFRSYQT